uniref:Uncharacterized protein n=1 Tax=Pseudo-nitzschia delicatissima TaxID=44447 RepID=A0A6T9ZVZ7_9STRA
MKLFGFSSTALFHALVVLSLLQLTQGMAASCTNFTKGSFGPETVTSVAICQEGCKTAEGLPYGWFKTEEGNFTQCTCHKTDVSGTIETRDLCVDGTPPSSAELVVVGMGLLLTTTTTLVAFMLV